METVVSFFPYSAHEELRRASRKAESDEAALAGWLGREPLQLTYDGRSALEEVLRSLSLTREDEVWIVTTFDFPNVSSCVTSTIFNFCKPSRVLSNKTKAILVIHEFGVPYSKTPDLLSLANDRKIPLIEDCAHTADSTTDSWKVGKWGHYVILSLPKIFPVPFGGALAGSLVKARGKEKGEKISEIPMLLSCLDSWPEQRMRRQTAYQELSDRIQTFGFKPLFPITSQVTPWFFPVELPDPKKALKEGKKHGVECGLWHGTSLVVFPCHQNLTEKHLDKIIDVITTQQL